MQQNTPEYYTRFILKLTRSHHIECPESVRRRLDAGGQLVASEECPPRAVGVECDDRRWRSCRVLYRLGLSSSRASSCPSVPSLW